MLRRAQRRIIIPFLLPAFLLLSVFFLYPLVRTVDISLNSFSITGRMSFVGLDQYSRMIGDADFGNALRNALVLTIVGGLMLFPVATAAAWALNQRLHGERIFRFFIFAPVVLSVAVVGIMWKFILHPALGIINPTLGAMGIKDFPQLLGNPVTVIPAIAFVTVWHGIGTWVILINAGFSRLPNDVIEAGRIDGAGEWRIFSSIMLPMMLDLFRILGILWVVQSLQAFAYVYILTGGGPFFSSDIPATYMYRIAFDQADFGYAAALGVALVVLLLAVSLGITRLTKRESLEY